MIAARVLPDKVTFNILIEALEKTGLYEEAKKVFKSQLSLAKHVKDNTLDLHDLSHGAAYIAFLLYFESLQNTNDFILVTGKGLHSKNREAFEMKTYLQNKILKNFKQLTCTVDDSNRGRLIIKFKL